MTMTTPETPEELLKRSQEMRAQAERLTKDSMDLERQSYALAEQARVLAETQSALFRWQHPTNKSCHLTVHKMGNVFEFVGQFADYEGGPVPLPPEALDQLIEALCRARGITVAWRRERLGGRSVDAERIREAAAEIVENAAIAAGGRMSLHALASDIRALPLTVTAAEAGQPARQMRVPDPDLLANLHHERPLRDFPEYVCTVEFLEAVVKAVRQRRDRAARNGDAEDARTLGDRLVILERLTLPLARAFEMRTG
jgi:hypothetical protein